MAGYPFSEINTRLDDWRVFNNMVDSPYYRDAVYEKFSDAEYQRRYEALRSKMRERGLDCVIVPGGPNHWSFGGGMLWLSGHWEWHAMANYVVFPLEGEPTLDLFHGRHAHRSDSQRKRHQRRAPVARRTLRGSDDRAHQRARSRARQDRHLGSRSPLSRLSSRQPVQCAERGTAQR